MTAEDWNKIADHINAQNLALYPDAVPGQQQALIVDAIAEDDLTPYNLVDITELEPLQADTSRPDVIFNCAPLKSNAYQMVGMVTNTATKGTMAKVLVSGFICCVVKVVELGHKFATIQGDGKLVSASSDGIRLFIPSKAEKGKETMCLLYFDFKPSFGYFFTLRYTPAGESGPEAVSVVDGTGWLPLTTDGKPKFCGATSIESESASPTEKKLVKVATFTGADLPGMDETMEYCLVAIAKPAPVYYTGGGMVPGWTATDKIVKSYTWTYEVEIKSRKGLDAYRTAQQAKLVPEREIYSAVVIGHVTRDKDGVRVTQSLKVNTPYAWGGLLW